MSRFLIFITLFMSLTVFGQADPTATLYTFDQCLGSARPYPVPERDAGYPAELKPVMINHVGRHGARFPSSPRYATELRRALLRADSAGTITPRGKELLDLATYVIDRCHNYWGALDSLGMAEQRGIASRMFLNYPQLFIDKKVTAISSFSPRCVMSMYEFTHQLDRLDNKVEIYTSSGRQNSPLMRFFDVNLDYTDYVNSKVWETPYQDVAAIKITAAPLKRILGDMQLTRKEIESIAMAEYSFLAGLPAMSIDIDLSQYLTKEEINSLWSMHNLRQYLLRSATTLSSVPADIASPLLLDLIKTTDNFVSGTDLTPVHLRFGHAETLMPLFSMLHIDGAYYLTNYFDTVGQHWRDFSFVPMAANLQMILFEDAKGEYVVRFDLNEVPIKLIPNDDRVYLPWTEARNYMVRSLPLLDQP